MNYLNQIFGLFRQLIRPIFSHLKNSFPVLFVLGLIILFVGIWTYGTSWSFSGISNEDGWDYELAKQVRTGSRIIATIVVLLTLAIISILKLQLKNARLYKEKNKLEKEQEEKDVILPYIKDQDDSLELMADSLKEHLSNKDYTYQLPWYMVIGSHESGKTSFINRSNQKFTLTAAERTSKRYMRKHTMYQIDWWASDDAILLDPEGGMIQQLGSEQDPGGNIAKGLWTHLLTWINSVRPQLPINGIILVIDLPKIITLNHSDRQALAVILRNRIRELTEQFGARVPVYVVLNKFDLVEGFGTFYGDLKQAERHQNLGFSFALNIDEKIDDWTKEFADSYSAFVKEVEEIIFDRLAGTISQEDRESLYMYSRQLSGMQNILLQFISDVLESDRFTTTPYVRGVYFSSIFQEGIPMDFYQAAISKQFDLPHVVPSYSPERSQRTYFTYNFFQNIVYPEAGLVSDNEKEIRRNKRKFILGAVGIVVCGICMLATWQNYFYQNRTASTKALKLTEEFRQMNVSQSMDPTGRNLLKPLNILRQATYAYGDYEKALPVIEDFGLYQGKKVGEKVSNAYKRFLGERFLPEIAMGLIEQMDLLPKDSNEGLELLRVYRMIDDMANRKAKIPEQWMTKYLQKNYPKNPDIQRQLMAHFTYAMKYVDPDLSMFDKKIAEKQQEYSKLPLADRVYQNFKILANTELQPATDLKAEIGSTFSTIFKTDLSTEDPNSFFKNKNISWSGTLISPLFTDWAYKDFYEPKAQDLLQLAAIDAWVLGKQQTTNYSKEDLANLSDEIRKRYIADYIETWQEALNNLEIINFVDLRHAVDVLDALTSNEKPLQKMVNSVDKNSDIYSSLSDVNVENANITTAQMAPLQIVRHFAPLTNELKASKDSQPHIDDVMKKLSELKFYMQTIQKSPEPSQTALKAIMSELNLERTNPTVDLKRLANEMAEPLSIQLNRVADEAWSLELKTALGEINTLWHRNVYNFYQNRIANRYPLNRKATENISLDDFREFFGPNGRVQRFYNDYLKFFLEDNAELSVVNGESVISSEFLTALQDLQDIQRNYFDSSGNVSISFSLKPLGLSGKFTASTFNIDGQLLKYSHEASSASRLIWPNTTRKDVETSLTLISSVGDSSTLRRTGDWSLFRVLDMASKKVNGQSVDLSFKLNGGAINYRLTVENGTNPFFGNMLSSFRLPSKLLDTEKETKELLEPMDIYYEEELNYLEDNKL
ncbi:type VI secretion system membrane subunit TssM [Aggregatibacter actinomycetemcomitans]|uniref:type VI secretion system membrane subunit TssM n=1 Tax=Aggregatibacter actinomycetemcomitans TaxID=714 RepID=UPI00197BA3B0|nr:type VI secretion system membrane subunit TssM [Aggregatibacter actinomycetemcomitans]MBN6063478.1 type VI secretion system membrane subunit TssM [Aggregatibacter actinomycetemcomitans]MBN6082589.1 type VI secretion system membrane subunit TssM [Aggregatibacter actinomycetemcomitans]MBN6084551.1 type VI secretion system membrane subunit TssM [Aggregatibacter actinomycetemcomitans]